MIVLKTGHAVIRIMSNYTMPLEAFTYSFEKVREIRISSEFLEFIYQVSMLRIRNILWQTFLKRLSFFDEFILSTVNALRIL